MVSPTLATPRARPRRCAQLRPPPPARPWIDFQAALSFLPALPPDDAVMLLHERAHHLEAGLAQSAATRELAHKVGLPRLFWVEAEFDMVLREAELGYVRQLIADIESGALDGTGWWHEIHERAVDEPPPLPPLGNGWPRDLGTR
jgi:hypothetical protein